MSSSARFRKITAVVLVKLFELELQESAVYRRGTVRVLRSSTRR